MDPALRPLRTSVTQAAARNGAIVGALCGLLVATQTYRYNRLVRDIEKSREQMRRDTDRLLQWPNNAPENVKRVLFGTDS